jgi:hypothetical protein
VAIAYHWQHAAEWERAAHAAQRRAFREQARAAYARIGADGHLQRLVAMGA